ncbi:TrbI/VirB10 family protein [Aggregatibacter actinomycetemcomitans]|uniref:type IV secretion system protein VirB10 n=1 Tax=Aggregatibacter actinomycetemcomitans TaxID=714 RepID=UPI0011D93DDB|nr:type IV secretion system protein VirB10 [Aggregatibacter actinomycetemcomitans]TYB29181.1 TrbI/VirB10 family protein [Aggregatibacter actinomycetemcomitans]
MTTNNQENGGIPSIDDTTSRNIVGEGVERKNSKLIKTVFVFSIVALLAGGLFMTVMNLDEQDKQQVELKKDEAIKTQANNMPSIADAMAEIKRQEAEQEAARLRAEEEERRRREQEEADRLARLREQQQVEQTIAINQPESQDSGETREQPLTPHQRRMEGDTLITIDNGGSKEKSSGGEIDDMLAGGVYANGSAKKISNRNLLLIHGTQIPCALQTRLVTDQPSITICQITKDIYSADGSTVLIERGSKAFGEQKKAIITGQNMAFVNWSEIDTPNGIRIRIDSLGTDSLGASGVNVWVDEKWGKRFGGAILLSFVRDALATGSQIASRNSSGTVVYDNSEANTGRMAEIALENSINIQPTGYALQGQLVNILVARDIDFSSIYSVR